MAGVCALLRSGVCQVEKANACKQANMFVTEVLLVGGLKAKETRSREAAK